MAQKFFLTFLLASCLLFVAIPKSQAGLCDHKYTVKGKLKVYNDMTRPDPAYEAVKGIKTRIYNGIFHIKTTKTKSDGSFTKTWTSCLNRLDLNIAFVPTTSEVNVSQMMIPNYYKIRPGKKFPGARPGTYDFGTIYYGKRETDSGKRLKVFHATKIIIDWIRDVSGINIFKDPGVPTNHVEIAYKSLSPSRTSWYTPATHQINLKEEDFQPQNQLADVLAHEFGHLFQHLYGKWYLNIPDYNGDMGWSYNTYEVPAVANLEGFATFFEYAFMADQGFTWYENYIEDDILRPNLGDGGATNHAAFYYDLFDDNEDGDDDCHIDRCQIPLEDIMTVFAASSQDGLKAFSIADEDMDDFVDRYYEIFGDPPGLCDFDELMYLNHLKKDPDGDSCGSVLRTVDLKSVSIRLK